MTLTVPPISAETQTCAPSAVHSARRGRLSTRTLATTLCVSVSMKCAMLVVSEVLTSHLPSGLMPMPSGSTPTGISPTTSPRVDVDDGDEVVVLVGDIEVLAVGIERESLGIGAARQGALERVAVEVEHVDIVVVAGADVERLRVLARARCRAAAGRPGSVRMIARGSRRRRTVIVLSFSFETKIVSLRAGADREPERERHRADHDERNERDQPNRHLRLRLVDAERIELGELVQETPAAATPKPASAHRRAGPAGAAGRPRGGSSAARLCRRRARTGRCA